MAHDACTPEAAKRARDDEVRMYLGAWCRIRAGERDAVDSLAPLTHSLHKEVARAALLDIVNLVADGEGHEHAVVHLTRLHLWTDQTRDVLAATYLALDQRADAYFIGRGFLDTDTPTDPDHCERKLAWSYLTELGGAPAIPTEHRKRDACDRIRATACALERAQSDSASIGARLVGMRECFVEMPDDPELEAKLAVIIAFAQWESASKPEQLVALARVAEAGLAVRGGEALAVGALEAARAETCKPEMVNEIAAAAKRLAAADHHDSTFDARLAALRVAKPCTR